MRKIIAALLVGTAVAGGLIACGGDDDNNIVSNPDSGMVILPDGNMMQMLPDGNMIPPGDDGGPSTGDGSTGDGGTGCAFTDFVLNAVTNDTNATSAPTPITTIGDPSCSYTGTPFSSITK